MIGITEYLEQIYEDFREEIDKGELLCNLKKLTFEAGSLPDYNNIQIQRLYLLRYAFAYAFEYTAMYNEVLQKMGDPEEISVVSVGCGTMIDYWALIQAIEKKRKIRCDVKYVGVDEIDWDYKIESRAQDEMRNYMDNAAYLFKNANKLGADVYFFPKSISEFTESEMQCIADSFRSKKIVKDNVYLCISIRENQLSMERDIRRTQMIFDALQDNGFEPDCDYNLVRGCEENKAIILYDNEYHYPDDAIEYLTNLSDECYNYVQAGCNCYSSCQYLNRQPVLKTGMIRYQVIKFERK